MSLPSRSEFGVHHLQAKTSLLVLFILLLAPFFTIPIHVVSAASSDTICLADPALETASPFSSCPVSPAFTGPAPNSALQTSPTQLRIGVFVVQGTSQSLNGIDVELNVTRTTPGRVLTPIGLDLSHSILISPAGPPLLVVECVGGVIVAGHICGTNATSPDVLHVAVTEAAGAANTFANGLLFTAIYNITGTASTPVKVGFQIGCIGSSAPPICVSISDQTPVPVPAAVQGASFATSTISPWIAVSASPGMVAAPPGAPASSVLTLTPEAGWTTCSLCHPSTASENLTVTSSSGVTASLNVSSVKVTSLPKHVGLTVSGLSPGVFSATVFVAYNSCSTTACTAGVTRDLLVATVTVTLQVQDFSLVVSPSPNVDMPPSSTLLSLATYTITSVNGFSDDITMSTLGGAPAGLTVHYSGACNAGAGGDPCDLGVLPANGMLTGTISFSSPTAGSFLGLDIDAIGSVSGVAHDVTPFNVYANGFSLSASPNPVTFTTVAGSGSTSLSVQSLPVGDTVNGYDSSVGGLVAISTSVTPSGLTVVCPSSVSLTPGASVSAGTCSLTSTTAGVYTVTVAGMGGTGMSTTNTTTVTVNVVPAGMDFTLTQTSTSITFAPGSSSTDRLNVTAMKGFTGTVNFVTKVSPSPGLTASCTSVNLTSTMTSAISTCNFSSSTAGTYSVVVNGTGGTPSQSHQVTYSVTVVTPDFSIVASNTTLAVNKKANAISAITLTATGGFKNSVSLTASPSTGLNATLSQTTVTPSPTAVVNLSVNATLVGNYTVTVTGTSGSLSHSVTVTVVVQDFTITVTSTTIGPVDAGASSSLNVTVTGMNGFNRAVALTAAASTGLLVMPTGTSVVGSGKATFTLTASINGNYTVSVTGSNGALSYTTPTVTVVVVDFTITPSPSTLALNATMIGSSNIHIGSVNGFKDSVSLTANFSSSLTGSFSPQILTGQGISTLSVNGTAAINFTLIVTARSGQLQHQTTLTIRIMDFTPSIYPVEVQVPEGGHGSVTVSVESTNGFKGMISLGPSCPSFSCTLTSSSFQLGPGQKQNVQLSIITPNDAYPRTYSFYVNFVSGTLHNQVLFFVDVPIPDLTISASPSTIPILNPGALGSSTITLNQVYGFSGTVSLTGTFSPSGLTCTLKPSSVPLNSSSPSVSSLLSCEGLPGTYSVNVTAQGTWQAGIAHGLTMAHSLIVSVSVASFAITATSTNLSADVGSQAATSISINTAQSSQFTGTVTLRVIVPTQLTASLTQPIISGYGTSTLTITGTVPGTYTVTVMGSSGPSTSNVTINVSITSPPSPASPLILGLDPTLFYSLIGLLIVAAIGVSAFLLKRRK